MGIVADTLKVEIQADDQQFRQSMYRVQTSAVNASQTVAKLGMVVQGAGSQFSFAGEKVGGLVGNFAMLAGNFAVGGVVYGSIMAGTAAVTALAAAWLNARKEAEEALRSMQRETENLEKDLEKKKFEYTARMRFPLDPTGPLKLEIEQMEIRIDRLRGVEKDAKERLDDLSDRFKIIVGKKVYDYPLQVSKASKEHADALQEAAALQKQLDIKKDLLGLAQKAAENEESERQRRKEKIADMEKIRQLTEGVIVEVEDRFRTKEEKIDWVEWDYKMSPEYWNKIEDEKYNHKTELWNKQEAAKEAAHLAEMRRIREEQAAHKQAYADFIHDQVMFGAQQASEAADFYGRLTAARVSGNQEAVKRLEEQEKWLGARILAETLNRLSQEAMSQGAMMILKESSALSGAVVPGGGLPLAIALFGLGAGGMVGTQFAMGYIGGMSSNASTHSSKNQRDTGRDQVSRLRTGTQQAEQTVHHHHYYGPIFGDEDEAARAVFRFHKRGQRLQGAA